MPSTQSRYREVYAGWQSDPVGFWEAAARDIDWIRPADKVFDSQAGVYGRWFVGAECNTCYNAVDRHVATRGDQAAIIYDSPVTNTKRSITYAELQDEVATLAAVLQEMGVVKGDRVVIYMPMIPETSFAMLACARIGAIHSVVFGGFAAKELATRIDDAKPKVILSASCGVEGARIIPYKPLLDEAIALSTSKPQEAERMTFGLASSMRVASSFAAKPPKTTEWIAPMRAQASMAKLVSGIIGM